MSKISQTGCSVFRVGVSRWTGVAGAALRYNAWAGTLEPWLSEEGTSVTAEDLWNPTKSDYDTFFAESLYILLNRKCNFRCAYCYAAGARDGTEMDEKALNGLLESFYGEKKSGKTVRIVFMGGGEPLLSPKLLLQGIRTARRLEGARGVRTILGLVTNGALLSKTVEDILVEGQVGVEVSFEVLREIQEIQRGEYNSVAENLRRIVQRLPVVVRTVATPRNVHRLEETALECAQNYPGLRIWRCDPVMDASGRAFYRAYTKHFIGAMSAVEAGGWKLRVENMATRCLKGPSERFCGGLWVAGPTGTLGQCPCDDGTDSGLVGKFGADGIRLSKNSPPRIQKSVQDIPECNRCFLRWNCAGGCPSRRRRLTAGDWTELCRSQRAIASWVLAKHAEQTWGKNWPLHRSTE